MDEIKEVDVDQNGLSVEQKRKYFMKLGRKFSDALPLQRSFGNLTEKDSEGKDFRNVRRHEFVEVARVVEAGKLLGFSEDLIYDLGLAAALHDVSKKREKSLPAPSGGITWKQYEEDVVKPSEKAIKEAGFSERVIRLAGSMGHDTLAQTQRMLQEENLADEDLAYLLMHYVDDYTIGENWVAPAETLPDGREVNDVDRRMKKNRENPTLANINRESNDEFKSIFGDRLSPDVQQEVAHQIEEVLSARIKSKTGDQIDPLKMPEYIDQKVIQSIKEVDMS